MKNCQEITELISLSNEKKLTFQQRCAVKIHLLFCSYCRAFKQNDQHIKRLMLEFKEK